MILRHLCLWERYIAPPRPQWPDRNGTLFWNIVILNDYGLTEIQSTIWPQLHWEPQSSRNHQFLHEKLVPIRQILWFLRSKFIQNSDRTPLSVVSNKNGLGNSPFSSFWVSVKFVNISKTVRPKLLLITNMSFRLTPWHGRQAFSVAGPAAWNCLSDELRELLLTANSFRQLLYTLLFAEY